ncbi:hypothetical protein H5410_053312 [Solanum commersonii]|uniref:Uncharacterized protein n=1 Tax=Solanum commersonii TaxID=4109 RepID=A0A9J5X5K8_SOLCO|nr:hypothetical protein H5410_053312 [Solanum commersonii]
MDPDRSWMYNRNNHSGGLGIVVHQSTAIQKRRKRRRSLGIVVRHPQALMAGIKRQYLQWRRKREEKIAVAKEVENKRYCNNPDPKENILPPCPAISDENNKSYKESKGDENGTSDKQSEGD